jgi:hypothetical protein
MRDISLDTFFAIFATFINFITFDSTLEFPRNRSGTPLVGGCGPNAHRQSFAPEPSLPVKSSLPPCSPQFERFERFNSVVALIRERRRELRSYDLRLMTP